MARQPSGRPRGRPRKVPVSHGSARRQSVQQATTSTGAAQQLRLKSTAEKLPVRQDERLSDTDESSGVSGMDESDEVAEDSEEGGEEGDNPDKGDETTDKNDDHSDLDDTPQPRSSSAKAKVPKKSGRPRGRGPSMRKWRRLAVEEKELITTEGGLIWHAARPFLSGMRPREATDARNALTQLLHHLEGRLDSTLIPPTQNLPHGARTSTGPPLLGCLTSWRAERGGRIYQDSDDDGEYGDATLVHFENEPPPAGTGVVAPAGFSADIALLEGLLLPEAVEAVSLTRALDEQEEELTRLRETLTRLRASYQNTRQKDDAAVQQMQTFFDDAARKISRAGISAHALHAFDDVALRETARRVQPAPVSAALTT